MIVYEVLTPCGPLNILEDPAKMRLEWEDVTVLRRPFNALYWVEHETIRIRPSCIIYYKIKVHEEVRM